MVAGSGGMIEKLGLVVGSGGILTFAPLLAQACDLRWNASGPLDLKNEVRTICLFKLPCLAFSYASKTPKPRSGRHIQAQVAGLCGDFATTIITLIFNYYESKTFTLCPVYADWFGGGSANSHA